MNKRVKKEKNTCKDGKGMDAFLIAKRTLLDLWETVCADWGRADASSLIIFLKSRLPQSTEMG